MDEYSNTQGRTTIDPSVIIKIAKLTALSVPGVSKMASGPHLVNSLLKKNYLDGILIDVENNTVYADLYLVLKNDIDLYKTSLDIQEKVSRAITEMVGMDVGKINIHIEDIDFTN
ncbi:MAG: Asp23/Gls24 family envelope stress response protein [Pelolinea sp.]|nr:Asp23/Gls24 family envelope stress response protein [Pelolinea sp.]